MSTYATVEQVAERFDPNQYDPTRHTPGSAVVLRWLEEESRRLDGQVGQTITTPVSDVDSPNTFAVLAGITVNRLQARIILQLAPNADQLALATALNRQADADVANLNAGRIGDARRAGQATSLPGAPEANFPLSGGFSIGQEF